MKKKMLKILGITLTVILLMLLVTSAVAGYFPPVTILETLDMTHYSKSGGGACGPSSGVSIGRYYRDEHQPEYSLLPEPDIDMYDDLYAYMGSDTWYYYYGYWFCRMTEDCGYGYNDFNYVRDKTVTNDDFWNMVDAINNGWPVALNGEFPDDGGVIYTDGNGNWPTEGHYWAIRGYSYRITFYGGRVQLGDFRIICTDSYSHADYMELDWNYLVGNNDHMHTIIIKDA